jgi:hypothetical protein
MGAAADIKTGLTQNLANFTKQRKAEEKHVSAWRWRTSRMTGIRGQYQTEAANEVMKECYMKVSDNNTLTALARQIYYLARPLIEAQTDKPLSYTYFSQTLLPNYVNEHGQDWDVVYDDRGHFLEPHTNRVIGLGTLSVRSYLSYVEQMKLEEAGFDPASVRTYGPNGNFGALAYIEKEGFLPLFQRVNLQKRYDIGLMSSKGMSVTAARQLAEGICSVHGIPLLVIHDFDRSGIIIKDTLENNTRRYSYRKAPVVIDFGLNLGDIEGLRPEPHNSNISDERLSMAGVGQAAIDFLRDQKVELNAMTSRQLVDFVERKLKQHGITKVIPNRETLAKTYEMFAMSDRLSKAFDETKEKIEDESEDQEPIKVPEDLETKVKKLLKENPDITWHRAVRLTVDPDNKDEEEDNGDSEDVDDEGLSDIDE